MRELFQDWYLEEVPKAYRSWARENKKRADRMLAAARRLNACVWDKLTEHGEDYEAMSELYNAAVDYEDEIG